MLVESGGCVETTTSTPESRPLQVPFLLGDLSTRGHTLSDEQAALSCGYARLF